MTWSCSMPCALASMLYLNESGTQALHSPVFRVSFVPWISLSAWPEPAIRLATPLGPFHLHGRHHVLVLSQLLEASLVRVRQAPVLPLLAKGGLLLLQDRVLGTSEHRFGDAVLEDQPLQVPAELRVAF